MRVFLIAALTVGFTGPVLAKDIKSARYVEPTDVYGHGAVKNGEYAGLRITYDDESENTVRFDGAVFEDTAPRLADLDADGTPEVVAVLTGFEVGAMVQVYDFDGTWARPVGQTVPIGERNRWLAIAGITDMNGDGILEVAYVDRPHLAKVLKLVTVALVNGKALFTPLAEIEGLSNHLLGTPEIEGGIRNCPGTDPVILTANADWTKVMETRWDGFALKAIAVADYVGPQSFTPFLICN